MANRGMRDEYFDALFPSFMRDKKAIMLSADNGAPSMDRFANLSGQFRQVGISEQHMVAHACGLALEGHRVVCYSIGAFTLRALESIKLNMCAQRERGLPITYVGVGAGLAYDVMGPTHHAVGCYASLRSWPHLSIWIPSCPVLAANMAKMFDKSRTPHVMFFDRAGIGDPIYQDGTADLYVDDGLGLVYSFRNHFDQDVAVIANGLMTHHALKAVRENSALADHCKVIDVFRPKPLNVSLLLEYMRGCKLVVTVEEDFLMGGLGSTIAEVITDHNLPCKLVRIGLPDEFAFDMGGREVLHKKFGLDVESISDRIWRHLETKTSA